MGFVKKWVLCVPLSKDCNEILDQINNVLCPIKVKSNAIELLYTHLQIVLQGVRLTSAFEYFSLFCEGNYYA